MFKDSITLFERSCQYGQRKGNMVDTCVTDRDCACFHDCPECNNYRSEVECDECHNMISRTKAEKQDGLCDDCFIDSCFEEREELEKFFTKYPETAEKYKDFLRGEKFG